jgi:hypothetical protein
MANKNFLFFVVVLFGLFGCTSVPKVASDGNPAAYYVQRVTYSGGTWNGNNIVDHIIVDPVYRDGQPVVKFSGEEIPLSAQQVDALLQDNGVPPMDVMQQAMKVLWIILENEFSPEEVDEEAHTHWKGVTYYQLQRIQ